jgi:hypothetical protein
MARSPPTPSVPASASMGSGEPRTMERTLADLTAQLAGLPPNHPRRTTLEEMTRRLNEEIAARNGLADGRK